ncbi:unnamed protein product [Amoebophrya sp. A120]|nr:unnamed protein product [Amoebophrya sp. A120]|eukprot:GSA120T00001237001.1
MSSSGPREIKSNQPPAPSSLVSEVDYNVAPLEKSKSLHENKTTKRLSSSPVESERVSNETRGTTASGDTTTTSTTMAGTTATAAATAPTTTSDPTGMTTTGAVTNTSHVGGPHVGNHQHHQQTTTTHGQQHQQHNQYHHHSGALSPGTEHFTAVHVGSSTVSPVAFFNPEFMMSGFGEYVPTPPHLPGHQQQIHVPGQPQQLGVVDPNQQQNNVVNPSLLNLSQAESHLLQQKNAQQAQMNQVLQQQLMQLQTARMQRGDSENPNDQSQLSFPGNAATPRLHPLDLSPLAGTSPAPAGAAGDQSSNNPSRLPSGVVPAGAQTPGQLALLQELMRGSQGGAGTTLQTQIVPMTPPATNRMSSAAHIDTSGQSLNIQQQLDMSYSGQKLGVTQQQPLGTAEIGLSADLIVAAQNTGLMSPIEVASPGQMSPVSGPNAAPGNIPYGVVNIPSQLNNLPVPPGGHIAALAAQKIGEMNEKKSDNSVATTGLLATSGGYHVPLVGDSAASGSSLPTSLPDHPVRLVSVAEYEDFLQQCIQIKKKHPKKFARIHIPDGNHHKDQKIRLDKMHDETGTYGAIHLSGAMKRSGSGVEQHQGHGAAGNYNGSSSTAQGIATTVNNVQGNGDGNNYHGTNVKQYTTPPSSAALQQHPKFSGYSSKNSSASGYGSKTPGTASEKGSYSGYGGKGSGKDHHNYENSWRTGGKDQQQGKDGDPNVKDTRTTMMLRNIPNKYTQPMLLKTLNENGFEAKFDFFYLPIDFRNRCNVGYAFVNFVTPEDAKRFLGLFHKFKLKAYNSPKVCEVNYARVQGLQANIEVYRNSPVNGIPIKQYRPLIFQNGIEAEFPGPDAPLPPIQLRSEDMDGKMM